MTILAFLAGVLLGTVLGVVLMCILQVNRHDPYVHHDETPEQRNFTKI